MSNSNSQSHPKTVSTGQTYTSVDHSEVFKMMVHERTYLFQIDEKAVSTEYYVGHPGHRCVHITANPIYHELILQEAKSHPTCSIDSTHEKKHGTVKMILAAVKIVLEREKGIHTNKVLLLDKSRVDDLSVSGETHRIPVLPLASYYMLVYGMTWYQMYLRAVPDTEYVKAVNRKLNAYRKVRDAAKSLSFAEFWERCCKNGERYMFISKQKGGLKELYESTPTWGIFFHSCRKTLKHPVEFFSVIMTHLLDILNLDSLSGLNWEVSIEDLHQLMDANGTGAVKLEPHSQHGGTIHNRMLRKWKDRVSFM